MPYKSLTEEIPLPARKLRWQRGIIFDADPRDAAPLVKSGKIVEITYEEASELLTEGTPAEAPAGASSSPSKPASATAKRRK